MNNIFLEIDSLHGEWEKMDEATRLGLLMGEKVRLNRLTNQFAQYIFVNGGFSNEGERVYARKLLEMNNLLNSESTKEAHNLTNDAIKELAKIIIKQ